MKCLKYLVIDHFSKTEVFLVKSKEEAKRAALGVQNGFAELQRLHRCRPEEMYAVLQVVPGFNIHVRTFDRWLRRGSASVRAEAALRILQRHYESTLTRTGAITNRATAFHELRVNAREFQRIQRLAAELLEIIGRASHRYDLINEYFKAAGEE